MTCPVVTDDHVNTCVFDVACPEMVFSEVLCHRIESALFCETSELTQV